MTGNAPSIIEEAAETAEAIVDGARGQADAIILEAREEAVGAREEAAEARAGTTEAAVALTEANAALMIGQVTGDVSFLKTKTAEMETVLAAQATSNNSLQAEISSLSVKLAEVAERMETVLSSLIPPRPSPEAISEAPVSAGVAPEAVAMPPAERPLRYRSL